MNNLEEFLQFEKENKLFDYTYKGVYLWSMMRVGVYLAYYIKKTNAHPDFQIMNIKTRLGFLRHIPKHMLNRISVSKKDVFAAHYNSYKIINNKRINPFIEFLNEIDVTTHFHTTYRPTLSDDIIYCGTNDGLRKIKEIIYRKRFFGLKRIGGLKESAEIMDFLNVLGKLIVINDAHNYMYSIMHKVEDFLIKKRFYKKLIGNRFKCVLLGDHYNPNHMALIQAARELGIPSVELQHGLTGAHHIAYNFLDESSDNKYFPDYFLTFGDYWKETMRVPKGTKLISVGFPQIDLSRNLLSNTTQDDKLIIIYSQGTHGKTLSQLAVRFAAIAADKGYSIKYKLHPSECKSWKNLYPWLLGNKSIEVLDQMMNVHELSASAKFHVGAVSTTLYEALAFDGTIMVYNTEGLESIKDLVNNGYAQVFDDENELLTLLESGIKTGVDSISKKMFRPDSVSNIEILLQTITGI